MDYNWTVLIIIAQLILNIIMTLLFLEKKGDVQNAKELAKETEKVMESHIATLQSELNETAVNAVNKRRCIEAWKTQLHKLIDELPSL